MNLRLSFCLSIDVKIEKNRNMEDIIYLHCVLSWRCFEPLLKIACSFSIWLAESFFGKLRYQSRFGEKLSGVRTHYYATASPVGKRNTAKHEGMRKMSCALVLYVRLYCLVEKLRHIQGSGGSCSFNQSHAAVKKSRDEISTR